MTINEGRDPGYVAARNQWQDWANLVLAIWLFVSPWVMNFGGMVDGTTGAASGTGGPAMSAAWNAWIIGVIVAVIAVAAIARLQQWEEVINMLFGIWLFIAPWVVGFTQLRAASWDHWIVGILIFALALCDLQTMPRLHTTSRASYR